MALLWINYAYKNPDNRISYHMDALTGGYLAFAHVAQDLSCCIHNVQSWAASQRKSELLSYHQTFLNHLECRQHEQIAKSQAAKAKRAAKQAEVQERSKQKAEASLAASKTNAEKRAERLRFRNERKN
ncbi:uncharacterized protein KY384_000007 [Bacidia gigantensis]|uniref:uncharacterized protein n=1 Tax=Bacidia gigantensis TaxID=2732470 RepID=UPI001D036349|nr:uncharacterized protein KY384_000007 [Bacidia gigantensis]KAG8526414.1 hypothetical protein KY384_000007 [Bacidia gigantensis]